MKKKTFWGALLKSAGYILLFFACQYVASFGILFFLTLLLILDGAAPLDAVSDAAFAQLKFINETTLLSGLLFLGIVLLIKRKKFAEETRMRKTPVSAVFATTLMGFACFWIAGLLINLLTALFPFVQSSQDAYMEQYEMIQSAKPSLWADMLYACLIGPFLEELLCRGMMWSYFKKTASPLAFICISGGFFALMHGNLYQMVFTLPLGMLLAYLICRTDSLWPSFFLHAAFNSGNYLVRIGEVLGFEEGSDAESVTLLAIVGFFLLCIPTSILLFRSAVGKCAIPGGWTKKETDFVFSSVAVQSGEEKGTVGEEIMAAPEFLIVGLGNPGDKYAQTRHNCGFLALDYIALRRNTSVSRIRFRALTGEAEMEGKKVLLMKPQTFMNLSGEAVREAAAFYKIPPERILVIFDDISFKPGVFRIRKNGSAGGHNGVKSIIENLSSQEFPRVKLGIGTPPEGWDLMNWVLAPLTRDDQDRIVGEMEDIYSTALHFVRGELDRASALYSGKEH